MNTRNLRILLAEGGHGEAAESLRALFPDDQKRLELTRTQQKVFGENVTGRGCKAEQARERFRGRK